MSKEIALSLSDLIFSGGREPRPRPPQGHLFAVVALGYALARDGSPSQALELRVRAAVSEWERANGDGRRSDTKLVFSGGHPGGGLRERSEAAAMRDLALELLLPDEAERRTGPSSSWLLEEGSTSTWENAVESLRLLTLLLSEREEEEEEKEEEEGKEIVSVSIITSPFHQRRAMATFRCAASKAKAEREKKIEREEKEETHPRLSFAFSAAPSPRPPPSGPTERVERAFEAVREVAAIGWYGVRGRLCGGGGG